MFNRTLLESPSVVAVVVVAAFGALPFAAGCAAQHRRMSPESAPAPVRAAVEARFPGAQVTGVEREDEHGKVVYDYELRHAGRKFETDVREDGTILEVEQQPGGQRSSGPMAPAPRGAGRPRTC